jgi:hypothetical protein
VAEHTEAQRKRAESRKRRRSGSEPKAAERDDGSVNESGEDGEQPLEAVKHAAKVAAAGAAVGAAAAAARALTSRSGDDDEPSADEDEPEASPQAAQVQQEPEQEAGQEQEPEPAETGDEPAGKQPPPGPERAREDDVRGATPDAARTTVERAREQLEALLERPVESVSTFERTDGGWLVTLEVVEVSRIPESTDVLASYQMELDDDRNLRRYARVRRYHRSAAERGEQQ